MEITGLEIKEILISDLELEDAFTQWAQDMAVKLEEERMEEERLLAMDQNSTYSANIDRSASTLLERCKEDPKEVGKWMTRMFLRILVATKRKEWDD